MSLIDTQPVNEFTLRERVTSLLRSPSSVGIVFEIELVKTCKYSRFVSCPSVVGNVPIKNIFRNIDAKNQSICLDLSIDCYLNKGI